MSDKEMTLRMRIVAQGEEGRRMFKQLNQDIVSFQKNQKELWGGIGGAAALPFKAIGAAGGVLFAPLKIAAEAAGALTGGFIALGSAALYAAAEDEKLQSRLAGVAGSALQGARAMEVLESMSRHGTFKTEDLGEAAILMKNYGIDSQRALRAVASAAKVAGVGVGDLALQTMALQSRGMKRFGITLDDTKDNPVIKFRDRMGQIRTIVTKDADEARKKLVDVFALKFGTDISPKTFSGFVQMLKNNVDQVFANFGDGLLPAAKRFIDFISGGLSTAIESGDIKKWGEKAGKWLNEAVISFKAFIETAKQVFGNISKSLKEGTAGMGEVLSAIFTAAANILGVSFVEYLIAAKDVFIGIGQLIAGAIISMLATNPILKNLPGMDTALNTTATSNLRSMDHDQMLGVRRKFVGPDANFDPGMSDDKMRAMLEFQVGANTKMRDALASGFGKDMMASGIQSFKDAIPALINRVSATSKVEMANVNKKFKAATGFDTSVNYDETRARIAAQDEQSGQESVTARFTEMVADPNNSTSRTPRFRDVTRNVPKGQFNVGDTTSGGAVIININGPMNVTASNAGRVQHEIITSAKKGVTLGYAQ